MVKSYEFSLRSLYEQAARKFEHFQHVRHYREYLKGESLIRAVYEQSWLKRDLAKPDFVITHTTIEDATRIARVLALFGLNSHLYSHKTYQHVATPPLFDHTSDAVTHALSEVMHDLAKREAGDGPTTDDLGYAAALSHHATILSWNEFGVDPFTDTPYKVARDKRRI